MFTCLVKYTVDLNKLDAFEHYARTWIHLIEKYGGTHHGYFMPGDESSEFPEARFSFPGLGKQGADDVAVALFSFPDVASYEKYRKDVCDDEECKTITAYFNKEKPFTSYERNFLSPILLKDS